MIWESRTSVTRCLLSRSFLLILLVSGGAALSIGWRGMVLLGGVALFLFFLFSAARVSLTPDGLVLRQVGSVRRVDLRELERVRVRQNTLDRFLGTGELRMDIRGKDPIFLRYLRDPYEGWKQIKIARWKATQGHP